MMRPPGNDRPPKGGDSLLSKLLSEHDLKAFRKNIEELGEENGFLDNEDQMDEEPLPKKTLVLKMNPKTSPERLDDSLHISRAVCRPGQTTMLDIVNDRKSGMPTQAEAEKVKYKQRSNPSDKKVSGKVLGKGRFEEDKPKISLAEQILFKKNSPSVIQPKKRLSPAVWTPEETKRFFYILQFIGMDFTVMEQFFPKRNRKQLLRKFHKERKKNPKAIEQALANNVKMQGSTSQQALRLMNNSGDFKFSESGSSSFDSTDQVTV